jgi:hypothetical protein
MMPVMVRDVPVVCVMLAGLCGKSKKQASKYDAGDAQHVFFLRG